jgi:spore coat protein CotH
MTCLLFIAASALLLAQVQLSAQTQLPVFLDQTGVEDVRLTLAPSDWAALKANYLDNTYYPADFEWRGQKWSQVGIRSRGRGTRSAVKPALRIDFGRYVSSLRFQTMKNLSIENLEQDPPMVREYLSMALFRRAGLAAPREVYIHMYVNGEDLGLQLAMEFIDKVFLKSALKEDSGDLYEYSWVDVWNWNPRGDLDSHYAPEPFELKTNEKTAPLWPLRKLTESIASADTSNVKEQLESQIDIDLLIRHLAVEVFLADMDGFCGDVGTNNFYIYRRSADNRFQILPWDKDASFVDYERNMWKGISENSLTRKILDHPAYRRQFLSELGKVLNLVEADSSWLSRLASDTLTRIRPWANADPVKKYSNEVFEQSAIDLQHFVMERTRLLREALARELVLWY